MPRKVSERKFRHTIYLDKKIVKVRWNDNGFEDVEGNYYDRVLPSGKYVRRGSESAKNENLSETKIDYESAKLGEYVFWDDGTKSQWKLDENGKLQLVKIYSIANSTVFVSLSPNDPSRHNKHSSNSK